MVQKGWPLYELRGVSLSLEDIFLELTTDDSAARRAADLKERSTKMRSLYAIDRKEMGHYFVSPVAYVVVGIFLFLSAYFFNFYLTAVMQQALQMQMQELEMGMHPNIDVTMEVTRAFFGLLSTLVLFLTPMLTMGVFAGRAQASTMELLMTSPITEAEIVLGKFLASLSLFSIMLLPTAGYLIFIYARSEPVPPWRMLVAGYLGVLLLGSCLLALGSLAIRN